MNEPSSGGTTQNLTPAEESKTVVTAAVGDTPDNLPPAPCIFAYYSNSRVKPAAFVKVVKAAEIKSFNEQDIFDAWQRLDEFDPTLDRTVNLLGKGPEPIARWVIKVTKESLKQMLPGAVSDETETASILFNRVVRMSVEPLAVKDKQLRARAQNLLRLVLAWLTEKRNLRPIDALLSARNLKKGKTKATTASLNRDAARLLARATLTQLHDLSSIAALFDTVIAEGERELREVYAKFTDRGSRIASLEAELETKTRNLKMANQDRDNLTNKLATVQKHFRDEKELRALDRTRQAGRFRRFLAERLNQPLSDALDALEIDPPHVSAARQRIEMAVTAISGELETSNE